MKRKLGLFQAWQLACLCGDQDNQPQNVPKMAILYPDTQGSEFTRKWGPRKWGNVHTCLPRFLFSQGFVFSRLLWFQGWGGGGEPLAPFGFSFTSSIHIRTKSGLAGPSFTYLFIFCLFETGSPFSPSWPGAHYVDQAGLELTEIHLPLPPECWD